jgi:hypothetical protein
LPYVAIFGPIVNDKYENPMKNRRLKPVSQQDLWATAWMFGPVCLGLQQRPVTNEIVDPGP